MALSLDIKVPDMGDWEKQTEDIADNFEKIGDAEKKANKESGKAQGFFKAAGVKIRAILGDHKKTTTEETKQTKETKAAGYNWKVIGAAVAASAAGVIGLGVEILKIGHDASRAREGALSMINAFTEGHGEQTLKYLDQLARKLGLSVKDVRDDWIAFNAAGMTNHMATALVKTKADLMAMGQSAEQAQGAINQVLSAGHNNEEAIQQLEILKRAFPGVGDGAKAAAYATHSFGAALNRLKDSEDLELARIWEKIGPSLARAANALSDFITKSPLIKGMTKDFEDFVTMLAKGVNTKNLTAAMQIVRDTAHELKAAWDAVNDAVDKASSAIVKMQEPVDQKALPDWAQKLDALTNPSKWFPDVKAAPDAKPTTPPPVMPPKPNTSGMQFAPVPSQDPQQAPPAPSKPHAAMGGGHTFHIYLKGGDDLRQDARTAAQEIQIRLQSMGLA